MTEEKLAIELTGEEIQVISHYQSLTADLQKSIRQLIYILTTHTDCNQPAHTCPPPPPPPFEIDKRATASEAKQTRMKKNK